MVAARLRPGVSDARGDRPNRSCDAVILAVGVTLAGVLIVVYGLSMTFPMFTWG